MDNRALHSGLPRNAPARKDVQPGLYIMDFTSASIRKYLERIEAWILLGGSVYPAGACVRA